MEITEVYTITNLMFCDITFSVMKQMSLDGLCYTLILMNNSTRVVHIANGAINRHLNVLLRDNVLKRYDQARKLFHKCSLSTFVACSCS